MRKRMGLALVALFAVISLVTSCAGTRTWDVSGKPEFQGVMGKTFELLVPCYLLRAQACVDIQPPGTHGGKVFPGMGMERFIGRSLGGQKVVGVMPAGSRVTVKRACYVETFSNRWFGVMAVPEGGGEEVNLFFVLRSRMDPVTYLDVPSADPRYLREVAP